VAPFRSRRHDAAEDGPSTLSVGATAVAYQCHVAAIGPRAVLLILGMLRILIGIGSRND
jgi:hypothetical protein